MGGLSRGFRIKYLLIFCCSIDLTMRRGDGEWMDQGQIYRKWCLKKNRVGFFLKTKLSGTWRRARLCDLGLIILTNSFYKSKKMEKRKIESSEISPEDSIQGLLLRFICDNHCKCHFSRNLRLVGSSIFVSR